MRITFTITTARNRSTYGLFFFPKRPFFAVRVLRPEESFDQILVRVKAQGSVATSWEAMFTEIWVKDPEAALRWAKKTAHDGSA